MKKPSISRLVTLCLALVVLSTTCAWLPFHADFTIHTVPEGATVYKDGQVVGTTPYKAHIFHFAKDYELRLEGFYDKKTTIDYNAAKNIYVKMQATPVLVQAQPNADIYDKGAAKPFGKTPFEVSVFHDARTYTLKAKDYYDKEITIDLNTKSPMAIQLERRPIITLTAPAGTGIYENDKRLATGTLTEEILTPRTFVLKKDGYYNKTVELTSTSPAEMNVNLTPLPIITIRTTPANATISLVGKNEPLGKGSASLTIEKKTAFEVKADRHYSKTFTLEPKTQTANIELEAMPYVTITSKPVGAEVTISGKTIGTTPIEQLIEKATPAELTLDGYLPKTVTLSSKDLNPVITLEPVPVVVETPAIVEQPAPEPTPAPEPEPAPAPTPEKKKNFWQRLRSK